MSTRIAFNKPFIPFMSYKYLDRALQSPIQQGDGEFSMLCTEKIQAVYQGYRCLLVPSCTSAIEISFMLLNLKMGDEVIMPSYNFTSAAAVAVKFGAVPVFVDITPETGCIDVSQIPHAVTEKTRAILWVNYAGLGIEFERLVAISRKSGIPLIEDAAHNFGVGAVGQESFESDFMTFSFHATKNIQCGEGGALLIKDVDHFDRAQIIREKGTNRHDFSRGKVSKYNWVDVGGSYLLAEINSALLLAQLDEFHEIQGRRRSIVETYHEAFTPEVLGDWIQLKNTQESAHMFALMSPSNKERDQFIESLKGEGIVAVSHYEDLASSPGGKKHGVEKIECLYSRELSSKIVRLPVYPDLAKSVDQVVERVVKTLHAIVR